MSDIKFDEKTIQRLIDNETLERLPGMIGQHIRMLALFKVPMELVKFIEQLAVYGVIAFLGTVTSIIDSKGEKLSGQFRSHDMMKFIGDNTEEILAIIKSSTVKFDSDIIH